MNGGKTEFDDSVPLSAAGSFSSSGSGSGGGSNNPTGEISRQPFPSSISTRRGKSYIWLSTNDAFRVHLSHVSWSSKAYFIYVLNSIFVSVSRFIVLQ